MTGCVTEKSTSVVDLTPLSYQIGSLSTVNSELTVANERLKAANEALDAENARLLSMLRADVDAGLSANSDGWLPFERYVWGHQLALLPDIVPDKATAGRWDEASTLYAAGGESAMHGVINTLNADAKKTNETLGQLLSQTEQLTKERDAANEAATAALERVQKAEQSLAAAVEQARQDKANEIRAEQVAFCNRWGGFAALAALAAGISAYWLGTIGLVLFGGLGLSSLILFGAARFLSSPWFGWTAGAVVIGGVIAAIVLVWRKQREAEEADNVKLIADRYAEFGKDVVPLIDNIYEDKTPLQVWLKNHPQGTESDYIDERLLTALGDNMSAGAKSTVHEIRASIALEKSGDVE